MSWGSSHRSVISLNCWNDGYRDLSADEQPGVDLGVVCDPRSLVIVLGDVLPQSLAVTGLRW